MYPATFGNEEKTGLKLNRRSNAEQADHRSIF